MSANLDHNHIANSQVSWPNNLTPPINANMTSNHENNHISGAQVEAHHSSSLFDDITKQLEASRHPVKELSKGEGSVPDPSRPLFRVLTVH
jgi:hypothetical protein